MGRDDVEVVSGRAMGADMLGEIYADENNHSIKHFPAEWDKHGKGAGFIRNGEMAKYANLLIAFWDGESKGTKHMIETAKRLEIKTHIIKIK